MGLLGNLLLPRLAHRTRWWTRLGPGGTAAFVAARVGWAIAFTRLTYDMRRRHEDLTETLRERLGREPTPDEIREFSRTLTDDLRARWA